MPISPPKKKKINLPELPAFSFLEKHLKAGRMLEFPRTVIDITHSGPHK